MKRIIVSLLIALAVVSSSVSNVIAEVQNTESEINEKGVGFSLSGRSSAIFTTFNEGQLFGSNTYGQMGNKDGSSFVYTDVIDFLNLTDDYIVSLSQSEQHTIVVTEKGHVFSFGTNFYGGLGNGDTLDTTIPSVITPQNITGQFNLATNEKIVKVRLGQGFSIALSNLGSVFSFGYNGYVDLPNYDGTSDGGKLGTGDYISYTSPQNITSNFNLNLNEVIVDIQAGSVTTAFISSEGRLFVAGPSSGFVFQNTDPKYNSNLPLDITPIFNLDVSDTIVQVDLQTYQMMVLTQSGRVFVTGMGARGGTGLAIGTESDQPEPYELSNDLTLLADEKVIDLGLGAEVSGLLTNEGRLFVFGYNNKGQLGMGSSYSTDFVTTPILHTNDVWKTETNESIIEIDAGAGHFGFISSLGNVYMFGSNSNGEIDPDGTNVPFYDPTLVYQAPQTKTLEVLDKDGNVLFTETRIEGSSLSDVSLPTAPEVDGYTFSGWSQTLPETIDEDITITAQYEVIEYTIIYELDGGSTSIELPDVYNINAPDITLPNDLTKTGHTFLGWYDNPEFTGTQITSIPSGSFGEKTFYARFSLNQYTFTIENVSDRFVKIFPSQFNVLALTENNQVYGLGSNIVLGLGTTGSTQTWTNITDIFPLQDGETIVDIFFADYFLSAIAFFMTSDHRVFAIGDNSYGALGVEDDTITQTASPIDITSNFDLAEGEFIISIEGLQQGGVALSNVGNVYSWGYNKDGYLLRDTFGDVAYHTIENVTSKFNLDAGDQIIMMHSANTNIFFATEQGKVYGAGRNYYGSSFTPDNTSGLYNTPVEIALPLLENETISMLETSLSSGLVVTSMGRLIRWGNIILNTGGSFATVLDILNPNETVLDIYGDSYHVFVETNQRILVSGANNNGAFGDETNTTTTNDWVDVTDFYRLDNVTFSQIIPFLSNTYVLSSTGNMFFNGYHNVMFSDLDATTSYLTKTPVETPELGALIYRFGYETDISDFTLDNQDSMVFLGFYLEDTYTTEYVPTTMPSENVSVYALFVEMVVVSFLDKDGNTIESYSFLPNSDVTGVTYPDAPDVDGYMFNSWSDVIPSAVETTNITIQATYDALSYTITFDSSGGTSVDAITADYASAVTKPTDPTRDGHSFAGWYTDEALTESFIFDFMPLDGATLYASWTVNSYDITIVSPISKAGLTELLPGETVVDIQYGDNAGLILTSMNRVFVTGRMLYAGFEVEGFSGDVYFDQPTLAKTDMLNEDETIVDLAYKGIAGIFLTSEGRVFTFGNNLYLQIGNGDLDTNSNHIPPTDITASIKALMDPAETVIDVFTNLYFNAIITSTNRIIVIGGSGLFTNYFGVANTPGSPVDVSEFFDDSQTVQNILFENTKSYFQTNTGFYYNFQLFTGSEVIVPVTVPNAETNETVSFLADTFFNDRVLVMITSTNRIVNFEYEVVDGTVVPAVRDFVEVSSSNALRDALNDGETIVSVVDQANINQELIVLTSEGRLFGVKSLSFSIEVFEMTLPEMNEGEKITYISSSSFNNYALLTNFGRAFGFGSSWATGVGLGVFPTLATTTTEPVELFRVSQSETPLTFEFGETLDLDPLPDQGDLIFRGYFLDAAFTRPFTSETMPSEDVILYPKFSSLLTYDMSEVVWDYTEAFTYDGTEFEVTLDESKLPEGVTVLSYEGNKATSAGTYTASVTFTYNDETHLEPTVVDLTWTIDKALLDMSNVTWTNTTSFTYDGTEQFVTLNNLPAELNASYTNEAYTDAGSYLTTVIFTYDETNYDVTIPDALKLLAWTIDKATLDLSGVTWTDTSALTYDGTIKTVSLQNLPSEITVTYTNDTYTSAGDYTTTATFLYDTDNYTVTIPDDLKTLDWTILKATVDLSGVTWTDTSSFVYDGMIKTVSLSNIPSGMTVTYTNDTYTNAGDYTTTATFLYDTNNFDVTIPDELKTLDWTIKKTVIDVSNVIWDYTDPLVFDGEPQTVTLLNLPEGLTVTYDDHSYTKAGTYTTSITLNYDQDNYETVVIDNLTWVILPTYTVTFYDGDTVLLEVTNIEGTPITAPSVSNQENEIFKGWSDSVPSAIGSSDIDLFATFLILSNNIDTEDVLAALDLSDFSEDDVTLEIEVAMITEMLADTSDFVDFRSDTILFELIPKLFVGDNETTLNTLSDTITLSFETTFGKELEDLEELEIYVFDREGNALDFTYDIDTQTLSVTTSDVNVYVLMPSANAGWIYIASFAAFLGLVSFIIYKGGFGFLRSRRSCFAVFKKRRKDEEEENN